jgi:hypothetical protein
MGELFPLLGAIVAVGASIIGAIAREGRFAFGPFVIGREEAAEPTTEDRLNRLSASLREAASIGDEIQDEIERRTVRLEELRSKAEEYEQLARLNEAEAEAVAAIVRGASKADEGRAIKRDILMNLVFIVVGVVLTIGVHQAGYA